MPHDDSGTLSLPVAGVLCILVLCGVVLSAPLALSLFATGALIERARGEARADSRDVPGQAVSAHPPPGVLGSGAWVAPLAIAPIPRTLLPGLQLGWADRPALNQYATANYRDRQVWQIWRDADCSAAALAWFLGAYGHPLGAIDDAIALIGPSTGISPALGLLDARGPALARALAATGLTPRTPESRPLGSIAELQAWLDHGPLLMDGARWFGEGHWFVATSYDSNGVFVRDSSGWDTRYLPWSRLYGEVGFSGWVVGVNP